MQVVECVSDDLMAGGIDPEGDERDLVHQLPGHGRGGVPTTAAAAARRLPVGIPAIPEQAGRVVLDAKDLPVLEPLAADQRVLALFELEPQEVRRIDELGLAGLIEQAVDVGGRGWWSLYGLDKRAIGTFDPSIARLGPPQELLLILSALLLANRDAVSRTRTADEEPVANVPGVFAPLPPDGHVDRTAQLELLALVEDVLLQPFPVLVAPGEHRGHELIEIRLG